MMRSKNIKDLQAMLVKWKNYADTVCQYKKGTLCNKNGHWCNIHTCTGGEIRKGDNTMRTPYNKEIHGKALKIIEENKRIEVYEDDCIKAGICCKCGWELERRDDVDEYRNSGMVCAVCGHIAKILVRRRKM